MTDVGVLKILDYYFPISSVEYWSISEVKKGSYRAYIYLKGRKHEIVIDSKSKINVEFVGGEK